MRVNVARRAVPRPSLELTARDIQFLGSRGGEGGDYGGFEDDFAAPPRDVNDIPF